MQYTTGPIMNLTIIVIVLIGLAPNSNAQVDTAVQDTRSSQAESVVIGILQTQADAWNKGDIDAFMEAYWKSPELSFSSGGETIWGWKDTLDRYKKKYPTRDEMGKLKFDHIEFRLLAPEVALVLGQWHLTRASDAPHGNFSLVLKVIGDQWRIVHDHTSSLTEADAVDKKQ